MFLTHYAFQREHLLFHVPIHVRAKRIFTLVNEGPKYVALVQLSSYKCFNLT